VPKRQSGNPAKRATPEPTVKHKHPEAFCLMRYRADNRQLEEVIFNSRDGVTPFVITMRDGTPGTHIDWRGDVYAPDHQPKVGDRIFVDLSQERAREIARGNAEHMWDRPADADISYTVRDQFESVDHLAAYLLEGLTDEIDRHGPDLIEVTEDYARAHGWPVEERGPDKLKQILDEA
jgi:hypothetical protein